MKEMYFKMEADFLQGSKVQLLLERMGAEGLGFYLLLLIELLNYDDHKASIIALKRVARKYGVSDEVASGVIYTFGLFEVCDETDGFAYLSSVYLDRVMADIKGMKERCSMGGKRGADTRRRMRETPAEAGEETAGEAEPFFKVVATTFQQEEEEEDILKGQVNIEKENEIYTTRLKKNDDSWKKHIDEAIKDETWIELVTMRSGLPFMTRAEEIAAIFKNHVVIQASERNIYSEAEARRYMANAVNVGSPSRETILRELRKNSKIKKSKDPYRFEERDAATGRRSYYGITIPEHAPPRPGEFAQWNDRENRWLE